MALLWNVLVPVTLALATNGLIFALGWNRPDYDTQPWFAPPGYVIGMVWTALFALMGAARHYADMRDKRLVAALILLCLAYPFYTAGLQDRMAGLIGIAVTGTFALYIIFRSWKPARRTAILLLPLVGWLFFAAVLIQSVNRLNV